MALDTVVVTAFITLMGGGLGTLFWSRLNRIEANMATRHDIDQIHEDLVQLRTDQSGVRQELAVMRSDLTHVALAVGARPPKASEG